MISMQKSDRRTLHQEPLTRLIQQAQTGDLDAFRAIFEITKLRVYRVAFGILQNRESANDAVQESFVRLYRGLKNLDPERPLFTYLYKITVNACFDLLKKWRPDQKVSLESGRHLTEPSANPSSTLESQEQLDVLRKLAARLSPQQRAVFFLRHLEGLELPEIVNSLGWHPATVRSQLHFARKRMKQWLEKEYPEFLED